MGYGRVRVRVMVRVRVRIRRQFLAFMKSNVVRSNVAHPHPGHGPGAF